MLKVENASWVWSFTRLCNPCASSRDIKQG